MSYIILSRNPTNKRLLAIQEFDNTGPTAISEYPTEEAAHRDAEHIGMCRAWGYQIIKVES